MVSGMTMAVIESIRDDRCDPGRRAPATVFLFAASPGADRAWWGAVSSSSAVVGAFFSLASMAGLLAGCSDSGVSYGPPGGLSGKSLPQPTQSSPGPAASPEGGSVADAGSRSRDAGSTDGAAAIDSGACPVSWSTQLFPNMTATGRWKCGDSTCHGGFQSPKVTADPRTTYAAFAAFTMTPPAPAIPFVLSGGIDPGQSGIECNLGSTACGAQMPLTQAGAQPLTKADVTMLDTWVKCGAPEN
jgi:hypothetical protein